jgi:3'(2'), 5'-bisphosphate nucleotidase
MILQKSFALTGDGGRELLESVRRLAREAGAAIMAEYAGDIAVELKADESPLTAADEAAHRVIVAGLESLDPKLPVLSEESPETDLIGRRRWRDFWLVDPLDGTKEFIKRNGEFTVNIALISDHEPVLGVVFAPALDDMYSGISGVDAWRAHAGAETKPIRAATKAAQPLRVVGSRSHASPQLARYVDALGEHVMKPMGSSLKICLVAAGEADVYPRFGPTSEWDTAAAHAILVSAGGSMIDLDGRPLRYNTKADVLNPHFIAFGDRDRDWLRLATDK